jgi:leucyl-tRNA---protein transferase
VFYHDSFSPESLSGAELDHFLELGWYRMHQSLFTTSHVDLNDLYRVHWLRYAIPSIHTHRSHTRLRNRNKNFMFTIEDFSTVRTDHQELHSRYRASIDFDGALSIRECLFSSSSTDQSIFKTKCLSVFDGDKLIAGSYFDLGQHTAASILNFYDPLYAKHSLGKYMILLTIDFLRDNHYHFYYPGYVVEGLSKMDYKLFLGREVATYFDPITITWKNFDDQILVRQSQEELLQLIRKAAQQSEGAP